MAAANKFATMLHKNTNKLTLILVYVLLEWILIILLLLNSLFSYLLIQYADFFDLKRPCVFCSRLDHIFDSSKSYRDLVCDDHASEISKLGYCSNHRKLAESEDMCDDCSKTGVSNKFAFFPWMKQIGVIDELRNENGDMGLNCSCCGVKLCSKSCLLVKPSWGILDCKLNIAHGEDNFHDDQIRSVFAHEKEQKIEENPESELDDDDNLKVSIDKSIDVHAPQRTELYIDEEEDCNLIPIAKKLDDDEGNFGDEEDFVMDFDKPVDEVFVKIPALATIHEGEEEVAKSGELELIEKESNKSSNSITAGDLISFDAHEDTEEEVLEMQSDEIEAEEEVLEMQSDEIEAEEEVLEMQSDEIEAEEEVLEMQSDEIEAEEEGLEMQSDEIEAEVSIGPEIPDHEPIDDVEEDYSANLHIQHDDGAKQLDNNEFVEFRTLSVDTNELVFCLEINEDKIPDTPTYMDSPDYNLYKRIFPFERKEFGTEDYSDGSIMSDSTDGVMTMEKLKTALRSERKSLNELFAELEEERSASAVAANETMAMINRLQEEKAAMQMEALQYQRMMEQQSEYDQDALQLLNELMSKSEREKAELEKELEMYRKKMRKNGSMKSRTSSVSDELSAHDVKEENCSENTPIDLEESLASFENERVSILEQLKVLEEKLVILNNEEEQHFDYNGDFDYSSEEKEMNGKHNHDRKFPQKRLLPLFDATDSESVHVVIQNGNGQVYDSATLQNHNSTVTKFSLENKKHAIEEEIEHVYDRLQALEADREFLKHCISSLRKGDKGLYLLQEILQHLRDLRSIELRIHGSL